jgi:ubiquinone/menaquinone biosynthesis C-methylase UbiE
VADDAFLRQSYDVYAGVEEQFGQALEESLDPSSPGRLYDLVAGFGLLAGAVALDVGCGEGDDAIELARRFGLTVLGIDPVPRHIDVARAELARAAEADPRLTGLVAFEQGKAGSLPAGDQSVDLLWCRDVLVHVDDLAGAYREFRRVLRPGGRALIYQMFATELLEPREAASLLPAMGCAAANMRPESTEAEITGAGLRIDECIVLGTEWGEYAEEHYGTGGRHLLHAARLIRDPGRYIQQFGAANYDIALGDCRWHIYRMIGKLSGRSYLLSVPAPD